MIEPLHTLCALTFFLVADLVCWLIWARDGESFLMTWLPGSGFYAALRDRF